MTTFDEFQFDEMGRWSELKLEIVEKYGAAYTTAFAGPKGKSYESTTWTPSAVPGFMSQRIRGVRSRIVQRERSRYIRLLIIFILSI